MADTELAYLAGFFDGEGCIHLHERKSYTRKKNGEKYHYIGFFATISVSQSVRKPLEMFQKRFGGSIRDATHPGAGYTWRHYSWECPRSSAPRLLEEFIPYLTVKREEAELATQFYASFQRGRKLTEEQKEWRRLIIRQVKEAKASCRRKVG